MFMVNSLRLFAVPALTGCFSGKAATTNMQATMNSGNGVDATQGPIHIEAATVVRIDPGTGMLVAWGPAPVASAASGRAPAQTDAQRPAARCVESAVEVGQWRGVGLVEPVLECTPVPLGEPVTVNMVVNQVQSVDTLAEFSGHRLHARRNLSVSCCGSRSE